ncbi:glyoxalase superfamily protein [Bizionia sp. KMM 8389]
MQLAQLHQIHPILPVSDVLVALFFYVNKLGFEIAFADDSKKPTYAGLRRGGIEIHLQNQESEAIQLSQNKTSIRIVTQNIDALYVELESKEVFQGAVQITKTAWGTREFVVLDPYQNKLIFYGQQA